MKKTNGEGSIWAIDRKGKTYYMGAITIGFDNMGKPIRKTTGSYKKSKVIEKLDELKYQARHKLLSSDPTIMLGEVFKGWIYEYKRNEVQNNTFAEYETCYRLRIEPYAIAKVRMNDITLDILQRHFNELKNNGLSKIFKHAYFQIYIIILLKV